MSTARDPERRSPRSERTIIDLELVRTGLVSPADDPGFQEAAMLFRSALRSCLVSRSPDERAESARTLEDLFVTSLSSLYSLNEFMEQQVQRIAHELHDESGQMLASVYLALDRFARELPPALRSRTDEIRGMLDEVREQMRSVAHELRPTILDDLGLMPALRFLCDSISSRAGLRIDLLGSAPGNLPPRVEMTLYRIVQEALNNVVRHARATEILVRLATRKGRIRCSIRDNGIGFKAQDGGGDEERGLGLTGIRIRLAAVRGALRVRSTPRRGTELIVSIPMRLTNGSTSAARR